VEADEFGIGGLCQDDRRGSREGPIVEGQVCVSARIDDERLLQSAQTVQHYASWRAAWLEGIWHRYAHRIRTQVSIVIIIVVGIIIVIVVIYVHTLYRHP